MAGVDIRVVKAVNNGSGTQDFTSSGLGTPIGAILFISEANSGTSADLSYSCGFTDFTNHKYISTRSQDGISTSYNSFRRTDTSGLGGIWETTGTPSIESSGAATTTDGITVTWSTAGTASAYDVVAILFGGTDAASAYAGSHTPPATGPDDITAPGFEPTMVFASNAYTTGVDTTAADTNRLHLVFGMAVNDGSDTQASIIGHGRSGASDGGTSRLTLSGIGGRAEVDNLTYNTSIGSFDANGFTFTYSADPTDDPIIYFAVKYNNSPSLDISEITFPTGSSTSENFGGPTAFTPVFGMILANEQTALDTTGVTSTGFSFGITAFDGTTCWTIGAQVDEGQATFDHNSYSESGLKVYDQALSALSTATFTSFGSTGPVFNFSAGGSNKGIMLSISDTAGGPTFTTGPTVSNIQGSTADITALVT